MTVVYDYIAHDATKNSYCNRASYSHGPRMENIPARLKALRTQAGLTVRGLAEDLGMPSSSYAFYEDAKKFKKRMIPLNIARNIADVLEIHGVDRADVLELAGILRDDDTGIPGDRSLTYQRIADQLDLALVPEIDIAFGMGAGTIAEAYPQRGFRAFDRGWLRKIARGDASQLYVARGDGDSMQPTLLDEDAVLIDTSQQNLDRQDRIWAFSYGEIGMIKRLRRQPNGSILVISDNQTVAAYTAAPDDIFLIGRVIWVGRSI